MWSAVSSIMLNSRATFNPNLRNRNFHFQNRVVRFAPLLQRSTQSGVVDMGTRECDPTTRSPFKFGIRNNRIPNI
jgi:hypothetical protein